MFHFASFHLNFSGGHVETVAALLPENGVGPLAGFNDSTDARQKGQASLTTRLFDLFSLIQRNQFRRLR